MNSHSMASRTGSLNGARSRRRKMPNRKKKKGATSLSMDDQFKVAGHVMAGRTLSSVSQPFSAYVRSLIRRSVEAEIVAKPNTYKGSLPEGCSDDEVIDIFLAGVSSEEKERAVPKKKERAPKIK